MSARRAKFFSDHLYIIIISENGLQLLDLAAQIVLIIDLDCVEHDEFQKASYLQDDDSVFIIGYAQDMDGAQIKHLRVLGYDMVLRRKKLLRNLDTILQKVIHAH